MLTFKLVSTLFYSAPTVTSVGHAAGNTLLNTNINLLANGNIGNMLGNTTINTNINTMARGNHSNGGTHGNTGINTTINTIANILANGNLRKTVGNTIVNNANNTVLNGVGWKVVVGGFTLLTNLFIFTPVA